MSKSVPIVRSSYVSQSPDEAWDAMSTMYTRGRPHAASPDAAIRFDTASAASIAVDRGWLHTARGAFDASPDQLNIISVMHGNINLDFGRRGAISTATGDSYLYLPDGPAAMDWDAFGTLTLRLPMNIVARAAHELTDIDPAELRFLSPAPVTPMRAQLWLGAVRTAWDLLTSRTEAHISDLVHDQVLLALASTALSVFPSTAMTRGYVPGPSDVRPAALRRAVAYIDTHASLPVTLTDIAEAAATSPGAIRAAFRNYLDTTPTAYLHQVRLAAAHHDLQTADPTSGTTIVDIATRWGFHDTTRFTTDYRAQYRQHPAVTLRN